MSTFLIFYFFSKNRNSYEYRNHINAYEYLREYHLFFKLKCGNYEVSKIKLNFIYKRVGLGLDDLR